MIFQEFLSKEPLAPAVRQGDSAWKNIVKWTIFALIEAEDLGITSHNVDTMLKSSNPRIKRFLGVTPGNGKSLGLSEDWACNIVRHVGNYGEIFERNLGKNSPLNLDRGLNELWKNGGLMYSPPFH
jgi:general L-amino acid transport system substrate-binding protein